MKSEKVKESLEQWKERVTDIWRKNEEKGKHVSKEQFQERWNAIFNNLTTGKKKPKTFD